MAGQGRGAQEVAPQVRPAVSPPRAASGGPCNRYPGAPAGYRLPRHPARLAGGRPKLRKPANGGGGRRGGGAPIPVTFAGQERYTHLSPFWPVRKSSSPSTLSLPKNNS